MKTRLRQAMFVALATLALIALAAPFLWPA